jgi:sphingomyelin phosphodiesterase
MVFFTGDMPPHDIWQQTVEGNLAIIDQAMSTLQSYFPNKTVLTVFGNHEPHPLNV